MSEIAELLKKITGAGRYDIIEGKVSKVNEGEKMIDVELEEGVEMFDIKLRSVSDGAKDGLVVIPKQGSVVVFAKVRGEEDYILISASELDKVIVEIGTSKMTITESGYEITRGSESLKKIMNDLLQANIDATYTNGAGSTLQANNLAVFQQVKQRLTNLLP